MNTFDWPSERIPHGGIFHQSKVNYSKDTHNMIKGMENWFGCEN